MNCNNEEVYQQISPPISIVQVLIDAIQSLFPYNNSFFPPMAEQQLDKQLDVGLEAATGPQ